MKVFMDAWLERAEPVLHIRDCANGRVLYSLKGQEIGEWLNQEDLCCDDLYHCRQPSFRLEELKLN